MSWLWAPRSGDCESLKYTGEALNPGPGLLGENDHLILRASMVYIASSKPARTIKKHCLKRRKQGSMEENSTGKVACLKSMKTGVSSTKTHIKKPGAVVITPTLGRGAWGFLASQLSLFLDFQDNDIFCLQKVKIEGKYGWCPLHKDSHILL